VPAVTIRNVSGQTHRALKIWAARHSHSHSTVAEMWVILDAAVRLEGRLRLGTALAMRPGPARAVRTWLDAQAAETLLLSSVTVAELTFDVGALPKGRRKDKLTAVLELFGTRIMPFDIRAARQYAELAGRARATGKGFPIPDGYIAATAAAHGFAVASRNTTAFTAGGRASIDPWREAV
jgi:predicted nucleic acid-binding protein